MADPLKLLKALSAVLPSGKAEEVVGLLAEKYPRILNHYSTDALSRDLILAAERPGPARLVRPDEKASDQFDAPGQIPVILKDLKQFRKIASDPAKAGERPEETQAQVDYLKDILAEGEGFSSIPGFASSLSHLGADLALDWHTGRHRMRALEQMEEPYTLLMLKNRFNRSRKEAELLGAKNFNKRFAEDYSMLPEREKLQDLLIDRLEREPKPLTVEPELSPESLRKRAKTGNWEHFDIEPIGALRGLLDRKTPK